MARYWKTKGGEKSFWAEIFSGCYDDSGEYIAECRLHYYDQEIGSIDLNTAEDGDAIAEIRGHFDFGEYDPESNVDRFYEDDKALHLCLHDVIKLSIIMKSLNEYDDLGKSPDWEYVGKD